MAKNGVGKQRWNRWLQDNSDFEALEEYKGANVPIMIYHKVCGDKRKRRPAI